MSEDRRQRKEEGPPKLLPKFPLAARESLYDNVKDISDNDDDEGIDNDYSDDSGTPPKVSIELRKFLLFWLKKEKIEDRNKKSKRVRKLGRVTVLERENRGSRIKRKRGTREEEERLRGQEVKEGERWGEERRGGRGVEMEWRGLGKRGKGEEECGGKVEGRWEGEEGTINVGEGGRRCQRRSVRERK